MTKKNAAAETTHPAADNAAAILAETKDRIGPLLDQGKEKLGPLATEARARGSAYAHHAAETVAPAVAAARVAAKSRYDEMLPKFTDALESLANNPNVQEAEARGLAAVKALKGELQLSKGDRKRLHADSMAQIAALRATGAAPQKKKKGKLFPLLLLGALGGLAFVAWKKFFGAKETDWQSHTASAYQPSSSAGAPSQSFGEPVDVPDDAAAAGTAATTGAGTTEQPKYGDGAYVGAEPPEGYTIKGNERSMKYHTPETGGYERTIADVWFNSESAAEAAGFAKAQR